MHLELLAQFTAKEGQCTGAARGKFLAASPCFYGDMLKKPEVPQQEMELVAIESLVPLDHLLRKIDAAIDLDFIRL